MSRATLMMCCVLTFVFATLAIPVAAQAATPAHTDVMFLFDTSGSMSDALAEGTEEIQEAMVQISAALPDVEYGLAEVRDYGGSIYDEDEPEVLPWKLDVPVTANTPAVQEALSQLYAFGGGDGPEAYGRALWETDTNPTVGWRPGARHLIVLIADDVPHDNDLDEGITEVDWVELSPWDTGEELPGIWGVAGTQWAPGDNMDFQSILAQLGDDGKPLEFVDFHGESGYLPYWENWAARTGGEAEAASAGELVKELVTVAESGADASLPPCLAGQVRNAEEECAAAPAPTAPASQPDVYVALGDSYSSGQSNPPYMSGTDTKSDECHRSALAYPFDASIGLGFYKSYFSFHACSGAVISDFFHSNNHEPPQLSWLSGADALVTLTIGGNDADFGKVMFSCVVGHGCEKQWAQRVNHAIAEMGRYAANNDDSLQRLYMMIAKDAPDAKVVIVGYPRFFPVHPPEHCSSEAGPTINKAKMLWINSEIKRMDDTIASAVNATHRIDQHVLYAAGSYNAFDHHELCTSSPDMYGLKASIHEKVRQESFHPNINGHNAMARLVEMAYR